DRRFQFQLDRTGFPRQSQLGLDLICAWRRLIKKGRCRWGHRHLASANLRIQGSGIPAVAGGASTMVNGGGSIPAFPLPLPTARPTLDWGFDGPYELREFSGPSIKSFSYSLP